MAERSRSSETEHEADHPRSPSAPHASSATSTSARTATPAAPVYGVRRVRWLELAETLNALAQAGATMLAVLEQASGSVFENQVGIVYHAEKVIPETSESDTPPDEAEPHQETVVATGASASSSAEDTV